MDDVFELRSESKASYPHKPFTLSISPTNQKVNFRTETLSAAKHKKLPSILNGSLDSSTNENSSNDTNDSNKIASSTFSLNSSSLHFDQISNRDLPTNPVNSALLPKTYNKKNFPKKIQAVEKTIFGHRNVDIRNFDTTVTIDILNESDRFSRQSLDPLITNRDSTISRVSTRPASVKEPLFRKSSGTQIIPNKIPKNENQCYKKPPQASRKCSSVVSQDMSFDLKINELTNEESIRQEILGINTINYENDDLNNEQDLSDYDEYLRDLEREEYPEKEPILNKTLEVQKNGVDEINGSITDLNNKSRLDTINESATELVQLNIKKLQLNKKEEQAAPAAVLVTKPLTMAEKIKNAKSKINVNKRATPSIVQSTPLKSQSKSRIGYNVPVNNNSSYKAVKITKPTASDSARSFRPAVQSGSIKSTKPSTAPDSAKSTKPSITIETDKAKANGGVKNEYIKPPNSVEPQKKLSINNNLTVQNRPRSGSSTSSIVSKSKSSKSVPPQPRAQMEKALDMEMFNPTSLNTNINVKSNPSNAKKVPIQIKPTQKYNNPAQKSIVNNRSRSSGTVTNKLPAQNQTETSKIDKNKKKLSTEDIQKESSNKSASNLDQITENKELKPNVEINQPTKPASNKSSNNNAVKSGLSNACSKVVAQAETIAVATKQLAEVTIPPEQPLAKDSSPPQTDKLPQNSTNETSKRILSAAKIINLDIQNLDQSNEPVIYEMFQDYPQPFTSNDVTSSGNLAIPKKKKKVTYKKNSRTSSSGKQTSSKGKSKKNQELVENGSQYDALAEEQTSINFNDKKMKRRKGNAINEGSDDDLSLLGSNVNLNEKEQNDQNDPNELSIKLKSDIVKALKDKVDHIYKKYNNLILQQEKIIENSSKETIIEQTKNLSEQRSQFSNEMTDELEKNIDFGDISSNPELVKQLKLVYAMVKQNGSSESVKEKEEKPQDQTVIETEIKPIKKLDKNNSFSSYNNNSFTILNDNKKRFDSIRSNADIREVFSIVNGLQSKNNSISSQQNGNLEMTFPPIANRAKVLNSFNYNLKRMKLPATLSDKINTLIVPINNEAQKFSGSGEDDDDVVTITNSDSNKETDSYIPDFSKKHRVKPNNSSGYYSNQLDSLGNESNHSDQESNNRRYDVKYRNDSSRMSGNIFTDNESDFQFKWKRGNLIDKGAFGSVYQAMLSTGAIIAVKQIEMEESDPDKARKAYDSVREEVKILRELDHMNTVQFLGTMLEGSVVNIFMELIPGGTLEYLIRIYGPFDESLNKNFTTQIVAGINYIHSKNVVHRDIKGKNIMVMSNGIIKLIDFGCAKRLKKNQSSNSVKQLLKSLKGTPYWMSPEVIRETGHGSKADIWSTGCTIFEMATGLPPWGELQPIAAIYAIGSGDTPAPQIPEKFSPEARDFVSRCLMRDPDERPSAAELLEHDFLKQNLS